MFDNQQQPPQGGYMPPRPPQAPQPQQPAPRQAMPSQPMGPAPRASEPEDIFAGIGNMNQPAASAYTPEPKSGTGKKILLAILIIIIIGLLAVGGVLVYLSFMTQPAQQDENTNQPAVMENENLNLIEDENINAEANLEPGIEDEAILDEDENANANINSPAPILDSDNDGLTDAEESEYGTNPFSADTDNDGLFDREEIFVYGTDPLNPDTDGDGYLDGEEVRNGYDPKGPGRILIPPTE